MSEPSPGSIVPAAVLYAPAVDTNVNAAWDGPQTTILTQLSALRIRFQDFLSGATLTRVTLTSETDPARQVIWTPTGSLPAKNAPFAVVVDQEGEDLSSCTLSIINTEFGQRIDLDPFSLELQGSTGASCSSYRGRVWRIDPEVVNKAAGGTAGVNGRKGSRVGRRFGSRAGAPHGTLGRSLELP